MRSRLALASLVAAACGAGDGGAPVPEEAGGCHAAAGGHHGARPGRESWMSRSWGQIGEKTILELTLPGSHNSGNYRGGLSSARVCASNYMYDQYMHDPSTTKAKVPLTRQEFDERFIPWNENHAKPIQSQLEDGIRFFHLKVCHLGSPAEPTWDLDEVVFQHRGYTTVQTLGQMIRDTKAFLEANPRDIVVLGMNNLHNAVPGGWPAESTEALAAALSKAIGEERLITFDELAREPLRALVEAGKRMAVFLGGGAAEGPRLPRGIIPSARGLAEGWGGAMEGGDIDAAKAWLVKDLSEVATQRGRFYVMQANPNDSERNMFRRLNEGTGPFSLEEWLEPFLAGLEDLVLGVARANPGIQINAVSTDFSGRGVALRIALVLNGLEPWQPAEEPCGPGAGPGHRSLRDHAAPWAHQPGAAAGLAALALALLAAAAAWQARAWRRRGRPGRPYLEMAAAGRPS